jgi:hypothetical protein
MYRSISSWESPWSDRYRYGAVDADVAGCAKVRARAAGMRRAAAANAAAIRGGLNVTRRIGIVPLAFRQWAE